MPRRPPEILIPVYFGIPRVASVYGPSSPLRPPPRSLIKQLTFFSMLCKVLCKGNLVPELSLLHLDGAQSSAIRILCGSFPPRYSGLRSQRTRTPGLPEGRSAAVRLVPGGIPAHLVIPEGESPPPGPVTPGREFPPLESTSGRESPPIREALWILSAAPLKTRAGRGLPAPERAGPG